MDIREVLTCWRTPALVPSSAASCAASPAHTARPPASPAPDTAAPSRGQCIGRVSLRRPYHPCDDDQRVDAEPLQVQRRQAQLQLPEPADLTRDVQYGALGLCWDDEDQEHIQEGGESGGQHREQPCPGTRQEAAAGVKHRLTNPIRAVKMSVTAQLRAWLVERDHVATAGAAPFGNVRVLVALNVQQASKYDSQRCYSKETEQDLAQ